MYVILDSTSKKGMSLIKYNQLFHNEVIYWLENEWKRRLTNHEKHLVAVVHDFVRTNMEIEELKIIEDIKFRS